MMARNCLAMLQHSLIRLPVTRRMDSVRWLSMTRHQMAGMPMVRLRAVILSLQACDYRCVAMTSRLRAELEQLRATAPDDPSKRVFGIVESVKRSFAGARKDAGLPDLRFHDLRHSNATRQVQLGIPISEVGRILGHQQPSTTYRYVNANVETATRAAAALDAFNAQPLDAPISEQSQAVN